jgi:hypothetical protein
MTLKNVRLRHAEVEIRSSASAAGATAFGHGQVTHDLGARVAHVPGALQLTDEPVGGADQDPEASKAEKSHKHAMLSVPFETSGADAVIPGKKVHSDTITVTSGLPSRLAACVG